MKKNSYFFIEWSPFFLSIGIGFFFLCKMPPSFLVLYVVGGVALLMISALRIQSLLHSFLWKSGIVMLLGFLLPSIHMKLIDSPRRFWQVKRPIFRATIQGTVQELSFSTDHPTIMIGPPGLMIRFQTIKKPWKFILPKGVIRLRWRSLDPLPCLGDHFEIPVVLMPIPPKATPNGFDLKRWAYFFQVVGRAYAIGPPLLLAKKDKSILQTFRADISARIHASLEGTKAALAAALIIGDRSALSNQTRQCFVDAGVAHVLAISGLHLTLIAGLFFFVLRRILCLIPTVGVTYDTKKMAAPFAFLGALFYLLLSGASISTQRAFIMVTVGLVAILIDRPPLSRRSLMVAAVLVLIYQPLALFMPSFHLSFFAVLALIEGYMFWKKRFVMGAKGSWFRKGIHYVQGVLLSSFIASLATIPFTLYHFQKMTLQSLGSNLVVIPLMAFWIMPTALISVIAMPFGGEGIFLKIMGQGIDLMVHVAETVASWPGSSIILPQMPPFSLVFMMIGSFFLFIVNGWMRFFGVILLLLSLGGLWWAEKPDVFIGPDAQHVAVRDGENLWITARGPTFLGRIWSESLGLLETQVKKWPVAEDGFLSVKTPCGTVAYARTHDQAEALCQKGVILISKSPVLCPDARLLIQRLDIDRYGSHFITCSKGVPEVKTAIPPKSTWPWEVTMPTQSFLAQKRL